MLPLPLLPPFSAFYRCRLWDVFSAFRLCASACASGGMFSSCAAYYSSSSFCARPACRNMTTVLYPNNCEPWLKDDGSLEKWNPKDAGQMSFVVFQLEAQTCMCLQHATSVVFVRFVRHVLIGHCLRLPLPNFP